MSNYVVRYDAGTEAEKDARAVKDAQMYLGKTWGEVFVPEFFSIPVGSTLGYGNAKKWMQALSFACDMTGIRGRPVRALKRKFLAQFDKK